MARTPPRILFLLLPSSLPSNVQQRKLHAWPIYIAPPSSRTSCCLLPRWSNNVRSWHT
jgi:hypothetical protein